MTLAGISLGKTEHFFRHLPDVGTYADDLSIPTQNKAAFRSKPHRTLIYNSLGNLVSQKDFSYIDVQYNQLGARPSVYGLTVHKTHSFIGQYGTETAAAYKYSKYIWYGFTDFLNSTIETTIDANGNSMKLVTNYSYGNLLHKQATRIEKVYNDNPLQAQVTKLKYPQDYSGLNGTGPELLVSKGIKDRVIEKQEYVDGKLVAGELWEYESSYPYPKSVHVLELASSKSYTEASYSGLFPPGLVSDYKKRYEFQYSPATGLLQSQYQTNGLVTSYLYSYGGKLPVAELVGARYSAGNLIDLDGNTYLGSTFNTDFSTFNDLELTTTNKPRFDRIRTALPRAFITTYTYDPLRGTTSVSDKNASTQYFEYDGMGRLKLVRDNLKNILKTHSYNLIIK